MFRVKALTMNGESNVGCYYNHIQAFNHAVAIESNFSLIYIEEKQWCCKTNQLINKNYFAKNKSIYTLVYPDAPIYSQLPIFESEMALRMLIQVLVRASIEVYKYLNIKCPYSEEYFYSLSSPEILKLYYQLLADRNIAASCTEILINVNDIFNFIKLTDFKPISFINAISQVESKYLISYFQKYKKYLKNKVLKNTYGATYIEACTF